MPNSLGKLKIIQLKKMIKSNDKTAFISIETQTDQLV